MKISLCMIIKDEEANILSCLDRALQVADEAIIVDTGSVDRTKELLKENYADDDRVKLVEYTWENDFSKARNESLKYATGDWILVLDADERIFADRQKIEEFLNETKEKAFIISIYNIVDRDNILVTSSMTRLYKNENPNYKGAIHEQIEVDGKNIVPVNIDSNICKIYHYGYTKTVFQAKDKQNRNMDIIKDEIEKDPKNPFNWYNKGVMEMIQGNYDIAIDDFLKSNKLTHKKRMGFHNDLVLKVAQCMIVEKRYKESIEFIKTVSKDPFIKEIPDIYYYCGIAYASIKNYPLAIKYFKKAIDTGEYDKGCSKFGAGSFLPKIEWAKVLLLEKKTAEAIEKYKEAVFDKNNVNKQGLEELKYLLKEENRTDELIALENTLDEGENNNNKQAKYDFEKYKSEVKENIKSLVEDGMLKEAKELIKEYDNIVSDDVDIYSIKGVIAMMEGDMDGAEDILDNGMVIDSNNDDLLYNIGYLYRTIGKADKCYYFYKKLYHMTENQEIKKEIEETIKTLGGNIKNKILIGSPIHQKPQILKEFLQSLKQLNKDNLNVDYFFIDDNNVEESSELLREFQVKEQGVFILKSQYEDVYSCDSNTHNWKENLIWKVANFKDSIIKYAKVNNYDYLFFIDSDLVLRTETLKHLISTGKDIISEIFWTKWQPNYPELPQVWLKDAYTQYDVSRNEKLNEEEIYIRHNNFINKLRTPGIYEVGGLGACTLISKYAIDKGVSFKEIKNLSFWGEDRHFCIRAAALGLSLYVDTNYPAYHIYREEDLSGVLEYKKHDTIINKKKVALIYTNLSGSNTYALYKLAEKEIREKYDIKLVPGDLSSSSVNIILNSDIAIFTEGNYPFNSKHKNGFPIVIDLWHGFPLKAMGYADKGEKYKDLIKKTWDNVDYITSYSSLFNELMNKCISADLSKYIITGAQRNDLLYCTDGRKNIEYLFEEDFNSKKFIFYIPTYRYTPRGDRHEGNRSWGNIFGFEGFDTNGFIEFLEKNNFMLFVKLHPAEENKFLNKIPRNKNVRMITNELLSKKGIDLYEVLNSANILITDYSSVYFDTLLLDIPIIFTPIDLDEYKKDRGMLLEPYEHWTPGPKCITQESLQREINEILLHPNSYREERKEILNKTHKYFNCNSCARTWDFIDEILEEVK